MIQNINQFSDSTASEMELNIPASEDMLILARLTVMGFVSRYGFTLDGIEDLNIATNELCIIAIDYAATNTNLRINCTWLESTLTVKTSLSQAEFISKDHIGQEPHYLELSREVLRSLTDSFGIDFHGGSYCGWFTKQLIKIDK